MRQLPAAPPNPNLLVGTDTADDAGVYRLTREFALVQTADFFTPIVDDPFTYGQIAAANSLSDVYAMGGRPVTALNLLGVPTEKVPPTVIAQILRGGESKAREARCAIVGGHTIRMVEPFYGMSVTGLVSPRRLVANSDARPGDLLLLTKPLGTGIITTGIKLGVTSPSLEKKAIAVMTHLNEVGAVLAEQRLVRAGTDITGFGLLGHLGAICRASQVGAEIDARNLPVIDQGVFALIERECIPGGTRQNLKAADGFVDWGAATPNQKHLMTDAQTSGGLLLCVPPKHMDQVLRVVKKAGVCCALIIGRIMRSPKEQVRINA